MTQKEPVSKKEYEDLQFHFVKSIYKKQIAGQNFGKRRI